MQLLQSKLNSIKSKSKEKAETRTSYNCNRQGHIGIICKRPRRQFPRTQNRTDNSKSPAQTRRQSLKDNGSDQQAYEDRRYDEAYRPGYLYQRTETTHKTIKQAKKRHIRRKTKSGMHASPVKDHQASSHGGRESVADSDKTMTILQLGSASMLRLSLTVNSRTTVAVVDTAAEATIISDKVYQSLKIKPSIRIHTFMHEVGRDMKMETFVIGPVDIKIGFCIYPSEIYVALIDDEMLLGLDFLHRNNVVMDCSINSL